MEYRVGLPLWKSLARRGVRMSLRVHVARDAEAKVFVATSPDLRGLVVETATMDELVAELPKVIDDLMQLHLHKPPRRRPVPKIEMDSVFA